MGREVQSLEIETNTARAVCRIRVEKESGKAFNERTNEDQDVQTCETCAWAASAFFYRVQEYYTKYPCHTALAGF